MKHRGFLRKFNIGISNLVWFVQEWVVIRFLFWAQKCPPLVTDANWNATDRSNHSSYDCYVILCHCQLTREYEEMKNCPRGRKEIGSWTKIWNWPQTVFRSGNKSVQVTTIPSSRPLLNPPRERRPRKKTEAGKNVAQRPFPARSFRSILFPDTYFVTNATFSLATDNAYLYIDPLKE